MSKHSVFDIKEQYGEPLFLEGVTFRFNKIEYWYSVGFAILFKRDQDLEYECLASYTPTPYLDQVSDKEMFDVCSSFIPYFEGIINNGVQVTLKNVVYYDNVMTFIDHKTKKELFKIENFNESGFMEWIKKTAPSVQTFRKQKIKNYKKLKQS